MKRLEIRLLGPFEVILDGKPVTGFESAKVRALLAYLAAESNRPKNRDQLTGLLWPNWPQKSAMKNLRGALYTLRKAIDDRKADPPFLHISRSSLQVNSASNANIDVIEFERLFSTEEGLEQGIELYQGSFLEDLSIVDSQEFESWVLSKRQYFNQKMLDGLGLLTSRNEQRGNYEQGLVYARKRLELEPWLEEAHRQMMRLLLLAGRRSEALAQFETCRKVLKSELGADPAGETVRLVEQIRSGEFDLEPQESPSNQIEPMQSTLKPVLPTRNALPTGTVTFLFSDIVGSTPLWESQPEKMAEALDIHNTALRAAIEEHGGIVFKTVGDAFQAVFPTAPQALRAAIAGQRALLDAPWNELGELKVRMGLHTGEAEIDPGGDEYAVSHTKNRVARIMSAAYGGQILLSQETKDLVDHQLPDEMTIKDLGEHRLKGLGILERLYQVIAPELNVEFPPLSTAVTQPNNLIAQLSTFVGRKREITEVCSLLEENRLVTITGPGGMGKTWLSIACGQRMLASDSPFPQGIFLVNLAPLSEPDQIPTAIASAMGFPLTDKSPLQQLHNFLGQKKLLLLMDNCEHLLEGIELIADMLDSTSGLKILATSRQQLNLRAEQVYPIEGLDYPDRESPMDAADYTAAQLFIHSARRNQPSFNLHNRDDLNRLKHLCQMVSGMPLALELAASWVDTLSLEDITAELEQGFDLLETEMRDLPARHRSFRAAIDHSWYRLSEAERLAFSRLSVFRGGFTRQAAQAVAGTSIRQLGVLVKQSFLQYDPEVERYQVHELMRQYGAEKLKEAEPVRTSHLEFFAGFAEDTYRAADGLEIDTVDMVDRLQADYDNLRTALDWAIESGQAQSGLRLGAALYVYWVIQSGWEGGYQRLRKLLALPDAAQHTPARAGALILAGNLASKSGDLETALTLLAESEITCRALGETGKLLLGWLLVNLGGVQLDVDIEAAQRSYDEAIEILGEVGETWQLAQAYNYRGWLANMHGDQKLAISLFREGLGIARKVGLRGVIGISLNWLGLALYYQRDYNQAKTNLVEGLTIARENKDLRHRPLDLLGAIALIQGDFDGAAAYFEEGLSTNREMSDRRGIVRYLGDLSIAAARLGDEAHAASLLGEALSMDDEMERGYPLGSCLLGLAGIQRPGKTASMLLGASRSAFEASGLAIEPLYLEEHERIKTKVREALAEGEFSAVYAAGQALTLAQALKYARAVLDD